MLCRLNCYDKITLSMVQKSIDFSLRPNRIYMSPDCNRQLTGINIRTQGISTERRVVFMYFSVANTKYSQSSPVLMLREAKTLFSVATITFLDDCDCASKFEKITLPTYCCLLEIKRQKTTSQKVNNIDTHYM